MKPNKIRETPVLIVGGGITGLTACLFLLRQGITPILIEKHNKTSIHPRSRGFDIRAMELLREEGLSNAIREAGKALGPAWGILRGENLIETLAKNEKKDKVTFPTQMAALKKLSELTPEEGARCRQDLAEPILMQAAIDRGAIILMNHELIKFQEKEKKVMAVVRERASNSDITFMADYMIAADGAKSPIRKTLAIKTRGQGKIGDFLNIYFEADLADLVKGREFSLFLIDKPEMTGFLTSINNTNKWVFQLRYYPDLGESSSNFDENYLIKLLKNSIGDQSIKIVIISVLPWEMAVNVAKSMQHSRIFLAGDAAHTMTPYGGKGANSGMQDVHNLAWKIAAVLQNHAGFKLLETYHAERFPIDNFYAIRSGEMADTNGLVKEQVVLANMKNFIGLPDYRYDSSAVIGGKDAVKSENDMFDILGLPGTRFPHIWLDDQKQQSSLDLIQGQFLILKDCITDVETVLINKVTSQLELNVRIVDISRYAEIQDVWRTLVGLKNNEMMLVRPDGFIACKRVIKYSEDLLNIFNLTLNGR